MSHAMVAMFSFLYRILKTAKSGTNDETNGRHVVPTEVFRSTAVKRPRILDVGAGHGADLRTIMDLLASEDRTPEIFAIETFPTAVEKLIRLRVNVSSVDIERDKLPYDDNFFDVVLCNQVLEHTKEIFWIVSEMARVTKPNCKMIIGVPNLGSLHNRLALLAGYQPPAIGVLGTHVRGFTIPGLKEFLEVGGVLKVKKIIGGNFYPFLPSLSRPLSRALPSLSVSSFFIIEKISCANFLDIFKSQLAAGLVDTPYYRGPQ
jgi:SAM-dependent methyltransferase